MNNILFISDIHLNDWDTRDPQLRFRLHQNRIVAQNIIEVAKNNNATILVIAGDLFHKPINTPPVLAEAELFLRNLMSYFQYGFIIWGNHDINSKGPQEFIDSPGAVMLPPNLYYSDGQICKIDNTTFAFSNWKPSFDLSWIKNKVDVLVTHATIQYSGGPKVNSQILDDTKFDLAICGDIHFPSQNGKFVSIGIPQQNKVDDFEKQSGIIFNTNTRQWGWVDLNPRDNLLKFRQTPDSLLDGYDQKTNTWFVYQPSNITQSGSIDTSKVISTWTDINTLAEGIISQEGLVDIHNKVIADSLNKDSGIVDFNYTIKRLTCHNWRSIKDLTINFNEGDRILIQGGNGSGKSSILSALKYALCDTKDTKNLGKLDPFIKTGEDECWTEVEFIYQNKTCLIRRGSKSKQCYCMIDGQPLKYNKKSDFEDSMRKKFPFIEYLSAYFFDEGHQTFIGDCGEDLNQIISKYLRLSRIDTLNETAIELYGDAKKKFEETSGKLNDSQSKLSYNSSRLSMITVPQRSLEFLLKDKQGGIDLQNRYQEYQKHQGLISATETLLKSNETLKNKYEEELSEIPPEDPLRISSLREKEEKLNSRIIKIKSEESKKSLLEGDIKRLSGKGTNVYEKIQSLKPDTCPTCGQTITTETFTKFKEDLDEQFNQILSEYQTKLSEYNSLSKEKEDIRVLEKELSDVSSELKNLEYSKFKRDNLINSINKVNLSIQENKKELEDLKKKAGEKVVLPENFLEMMAQISSDIQIWEAYNSLIEDKTKLEDTFNKLSTDLSTVKTYIDKLNNYIKLTSPTGKIYEEIMKKLAKEFSDNTVYYETQPRVSRGKDHLDLIPYFIKSPNHKIQYAVCSQGQKTILDIHLLLKITTRNGLLVMDEFLSHLSPENHDKCLEMINKMNVGCILLSSHQETTPTFPNRKINVSLNNNDETQITLL